MKRRELTQEEKAEAARLVEAWRNFRANNKGATQDWLAATSGLGTQGAVSQYLRGVIPLNIKALMAITRAIGVAPGEISPRLTATVEELILNKRDETPASGLADALKLSAETPKELVMLSVHRLATPADRAAIDAIVEQIRRRLPAEGVSHKR